MYGNKQLLFLCTQGTLLFFLAEVQKQSQSHLSGNCLMQRRHPSNPVFRKQRHGCDYFPHVERMTDSSSRSPLCIYFGKLLFFPLQLSMASCATNGGLWGKKLYYRWRASASFPCPASLYLQPRLTLLSPDQAQGTCRNVAGSEFFTRSEAACYALLHPLHTHTTPGDWLVTMQDTAG